MLLYGGSEFDGIPGVAAIDIAARGTGGAGSPGHLRVECGEIHTHQDASTALVVSGIATASGPNSPKVIRNRMQCVSLGA